MGGDYSFIVRFRIDLEGGYKEVRFAIGRSGWVRCGVCFGLGR